MIKNKKASESVGNETVTLDRRRGDRRIRKNDSGPKPLLNPPQKKAHRRRHIDPTTCERDYRQDEIEFMRAMDDYKRTSGRMFPTCSEVLEVVRGMGYVRLTPEQIELLGDTLVEETESYDYDAGATDDEDEDDEDLQ